jgi:inward rectifier potassium channel
VDDRARPHHHSRMKKTPRPETYAGEGYQIRIVGGARRPLRDLYHGLLRVPWWAALAVITGSYLALNVAFALLFLAVGGIANAAPGSFADAFFFSVQTMGTIGYGQMYPATRAANAVVVAESVVGLAATALATGLVFARFSQTRARVIFSARAAISPYDGVPSIVMRVGNERRNAIIDAAFRLMLMRTTRTAEGVTVYRTVDLPLVRDRAPALTRAWNVLHRIDPGSPLHGETPESLVASDAELTLTVSGVDDTSLQLVHARHTWTASSIVWGARLADITSEAPDGAFVIDLRQFHELVPTRPAEGFPFPATPQNDSAAPPPGR